MIPALVALIVAAALGVSAWARRRARAAQRRAEARATRRARADIYLQALSWLDAVRTVHLPLPVGNGHDPVPQQLRLKRDLASIQESIAMFGSARIHALFTDFVDSIETLPAGQPITASHRAQIILLATAMADEIDGPRSMARWRRRPRKR